MAINTQSILSTLETKIASMDSNTPLDDMIVNIKSYQEAGGVVSIQYDSSGAMPILDSAQAGLVLYSASDTALYGFNGNTWAAVSNAAGDAGGGAVSWTVDLSNVTYDSVSFSIISQLSNPEGIALSNDGSKIFLTGRTSDSIYQYSLSTGFDLSTASYDSVSLSVSGQDGTPTSLRFNSDGTKMFLIGRSNDLAYQYTLSTAFDLSTASYDSISFSFAAQQTQPQALAFNTDGTKMYIGGNDSSSIFQYSLSTGFDISTASYDSVSFSVASQEADGPTGIYFSTEGTKMYICGPGTDAVYQYTLSTAFDISTASYDNVSFTLTGGVSYPTDLVFSANGTKMYIIDAGSDNIFQYSTGL